MVSKTLKFIKIISVLVLCLVAILFIVLSVLNNKKFIISTPVIQKVIGYYDQSLLADPTNAKIGINNYKIIISVDQLALHKVNNKDIVLKNINVVISLFQLKSKASVQINNTPLHHFVQLHENPELTTFINNFFYHNHLVCSGDVMMNFNLFTPDRLEVNISSNEGWHDPKASNLRKLQLKEFNFSLHLQDNKLSINKLDLSYVDSFQASLLGDFSFSGDELLLADFQTSLSMFPIDYLAGFWHPEIFSEVQHWITNHIKKGVVKQAKGNFKFSGEDLKAGALYKEAIDVLMTLKDMEVRYLDGYSSISAIDGDFKIDGAGIYLNNATGFIDNNKLENIKLDLLFDNFILTLATDVSGNINSFKQFIPDEVINSLNKIGVDYASIKGQTKANVGLEIPILEQFNPAKMLLAVKASLENVALGKKDLIKFSNGTLAVNNNQNGINLKLFSKDIIFIQFESTHNTDNLNNKKIYLNAEITTQNNFIISDKVSIKGNFKTQFNLNNQAWHIYSNFDNAEVILLPFAYSKSRKMPFIVECDGEIRDQQIIAKICDIKGKDIIGNGKFIYSQADQAMKEFYLNDIKIGSNDFSISIIHDKNTFFYKVNAKYLDLSNFSMSDFASNNKDKSNYNIELQIDQMITPNKNQLDNIKANIIQNNNNPVEIDLKAFAKDKKVTLTKISKNNQMGYLLYSDDAATFAQAFGIYQNIKKGELWLEMYPKKNKNNISYSGTLKLNNFAFTNTSALTKIILGITSAFNSPDALLRALQGGSLQSDSFEANVAYNQGTISLSNGEINGPSYEVKINGYIDLNNTKLDFRGIYIPSMFGINKLVSDIPIVGPLISGGKNSALIGANFSITGNTKNPDVFFNPLSALTPGFIRNLF